MTLVKSPSVFFKRILKEYWWVLLFTVSLVGLYLQASQNKNRIYEKLKGDLLKIECEHALALKSREDLVLKIKSQNDPEWLEIILMKKLGVVPDGQIKVHFEKRP